MTERTNREEAVIAPAFNNNDKKRCRLIVILTVAGIVILAAASTTLLVTSLRKSNPSDSSTNTEKQTAPFATTPPTILPIPPLPTPATTPVPSSTTEQTTLPTTNAPSNNENENMDPTTAPTAVTTLAPTTATPTSAPTQEPTVSPTQEPTVPPTSAPTQEPTVPPTTAAPTLSPTEPPINVVTTTAPTLDIEPVGFVEPNPIPDNPPPGYFNYDLSDTTYGPGAWKLVDTTNHWLREFGDDGFGAWRGFLADKLPTRNRCGDSVRHQSPKHLVNPTQACEASHQIRSKCGKLPLSDSRIEKNILPHALRLIMPRRSCLDDFATGECSRDRPPVVDYPKYSSIETPFSDLHHLDVKVPGEHTIQGATFDAEIQMFHTHLTTDRVSSLGIPIRAVANGHNQEFQAMLRHWQAAYDQNAALCAASTGNVRRRTAYSVSDPTNTRPLEQNVTTTEGAAADFARILQQGGGFDPYSEAFLTTMFFYRYDGSITEPPCLHITWWVMVEPMIISLAQLRQVKRLLFTHVDAECRRTSVHNANQSVTRPIQALGEDREIQLCMEGDFTSDIEQGRGIANKCE